MLWGPAGSDWVVHTAELLEFRGMGLGHSGIGLPSLVKVIVPVGVPKSPDTVAVKVTGTLTLEGFGDEVTIVVLLSVPGPRTVNAPWSIEPFWTQVLPPSGEVS